MRYVINEDLKRRRWNTPSRLGLQDMAQNAQKAIIGGLVCLAYNHPKMLEKQRHIMWLAGLEEGEDIPEWVDVSHPMGANPLAQEHSEVIIEILDTSYEGSELCEMQDQIIRLLEELHRR